MTSTTIAQQEPSARQIADCLRDAKPDFLKHVGRSGDLVALAEILLDHTISAYDAGGEVAWSRVEPESLRKGVLTKLILAKRKTPPEDPSSIDPFAGGPGRSVDDRLMVKLPWSRPCAALGMQIELYMLPENLRLDPNSPRVFRLLVALDRTSGIGSLAPGPAVPAGVKLVGRARELVEAVAALTDGRSLSIVGGPGTGKTTLARVIAGKVAGRFADAIEIRLWGDRGSTTARDALQGVVQQLSLRRRRQFATSARATIEILRCAYLEALAERPTLVLFDDVRDVWDLEALRPPPGSAVIFTSHEVLPFRDAKAIVLTELKEPEARELLLDLAPRAAAPLKVRAQPSGWHSPVEQLRFAAGTDCAGAIVQLCGGLPLAIEAAAWTLIARPDLRVDEYVQKLIDSSDLLRALGTGSNRVAASFHAAYQLLDAEAQRVFRALAIFPYDFRSNFMRVICGDFSGQSFDELLRQNLISVFKVERRYYIHSALRAFAASLLPAHEREMLERRFTIACAEYVRAVHWHHDHSAIDSDVEQLADAPLTEDRLNFRKAIEWCHAHEGDSDADRAHALLAFVLLDSFPDRAYADPREEQTRWLERACDAARRISKQDGELYLGTLIVAGFLLEELGRHAEALAAANEGVAYPSEASNLLPDLAYLGLQAAFRMIDLAAADRYSILAGQHPPSDPTGRIVVFTLTAAIAIDRGELLKARNKARQLVRLAEAECAMTLMPYALNLLGDVEFDRGDFRAARQAYERAYAIRRAGVNWFADRFFKVWGERKGDPSDIAEAFRLIEHLGSLYRGSEVSDALQRDEGPEMPELHSVIRLARLDAIERKKPDGERALKCALHLLAQRPQRGGTLIEFAYAFAGVGLWKAALAFLAPLNSAEQPRVQAAANFLRGRVLESNRFFAAARDAYARAASAPPDLPDARRARTRLRAIRNRRGRAFRVKLEPVWPCSVDHDHLRPVNSRLLARLLKETQPDDHGGTLALLGGLFTVDLPDGFGSAPHELASAHDRPGGSGDSKE